MNDSKTPWLKIMLHNCTMCCKTHYKPMVLPTQQTSVRDLEHRPPMLQCIMQTSVLLSADSVKPGAGSLKPRYRLESSASVYHSVATIRPSHQLNASTTCTHNHAERLKDSFEWFSSRLLSPDLHQPLSHCYLGRNAASLGNSLNI